MIVIANVFLKLQTMKILDRKLSKKRRFRKRFDGQHVKVSKILAKSPSELFYHVFAWFWGKLISKMSSLGLSNVSVVCWRIDWRLQGTCSVLLELAIEISNAIIWNAKNYFSILCYIFGMYIKFQTFWKKKMLVIANLFPMLQTVTILVRAVSKKCRFRKRFDSQHVKLSQILVKTFIRAILSCFSSFWRKLILKMSPLVLG